MSNGLVYADRSQSTESVINKVFAAGTSGPNPNPSSYSRQDCPDTVALGPLPRSGVPGADKALVPGIPLSAVLCRYEGDPNHAQILTGWGSASGASLTRLVGDLRGSPHAAHSGTDGSAPTVIAMVRTTAAPTPITVDIDLASANVTNSEFAVAVDTDAPQTALTIASQHPIPSALTRAPTRCPPADPAAPATTPPVLPLPPVSGASTALVPGVPSNILLCSYRHTNTGPGPLAKAARTGAKTSSLISLLNHGAIDNGAHSCPPRGDDRVVAYAEYDGGVAMTLVSDPNCRTVSNQLLGADISDGARSLIAELLGSGGGMSFEPRTTTPASIAPTTPGVTETPPPPEAPPPAECPDRLAYALPVPSIDGAAQTLVPGDPKKSLSAATGGSTCRIRPEP